MLAAVKENVRAFMYASEALRNDEALIALIRWIKNLLN